MGDFFQKSEKICANFKKHYWTIGGRKLWGNFSRNWEKVCANFRRNNILAGGNHGGIFQKFGEDMREFPNHNIGGANYGGVFYRNLEQVCANFKAIILAGGNYWGIFPEIWRRHERTSKKQYAQEEINPFP